MEKRRIENNNMGRKTAAPGSARPTAKKVSGGTVRYDSSRPVKAVVKRENNRPKPTFFGVAKSLRYTVRESFTSGKSDVRLKTVKSAKRKPFPVAVILMALLVTGLFMFMIMSYVQISEYTLEVSGLRSDISDLAAQRKVLTYQIDEKNDMLKIEKYATENLNMVKVDQLTKKHIAIDREDKIEVVEPEPTEDSTVVTTMMSAFFSNFNGLWEYLK